MNHVAAWYEKYSPALCRIALYMGYSKEDSSDFVHQFFLEMLQKEASLEVHSPQAFLTLAFKRKLIDAYRATMRQQQKTESALQRFNATIASGNENEEEVQLHDRVAQAYKKIPARCRTVIYLKYYKGLTTPEIVEETGLSQQTVYNNLCKGIFLLRKELNSRGTKGKVSYFLLIYLLLHFFSKNSFNS